MGGMLVPDPCPLPARVVRDGPEGTSRAPGWKGRASWRSIGVDPLSVSGPSRDRRPAGRPPFPTTRRDRVARHAVRRGGLASNKKVHLGGSIGRDYRLLLWVRRATLDGTARERPARAPRYMPRWGWKQPVPTMPSAGADAPRRSASPRPRSRRAPTCGGVSCGGFVTSQSPSQQQPMTKAFQPFASFFSAQLNMIKKASTSNIACTLARKIE